MVNVVLLAGTPVNKRELVDATNKAFVSLNGKKVIEYVLNALEEAKTVKNIAIVGPEINLEGILKNHDRKDIKIVPESKNKVGWKRFLENIVNGREAARSGNDYLLYIPCDIPLARGGHLDEFVNESMLYHEKDQYDFFYGYVDNEISKKTWGHNRRGLKLKEGSYRAANVALVRPDGIGKLEDEKRKLELLARCFDSTRKLKKLKSIIILAWKIGCADTACGYINYKLGKLSINDVEDYVSNALNTRFKLVKSNHTELEYDIDVFHDYANITRYVLDREYRSKEEPRIS